MIVKNAIIKEYSHIPIDELAGKPVYALSGISDRSALTLYKAFHVETIHDLAELEYARWAKTICDSADKGDSHLNAGFAETVLKKKFRELSPAMVAEGPLYMLLGLSRKKTRLLRRDLGINTLRDLSGLRFVKLARNLDYKEKLIKDFKNAHLADLPRVPVYAFQGLSVKDAGLFKAAFGVETIEDLANLKYLHWAREIADADDRGEDIDRELFSDRLIKKYESTPIKKLLKAPVSAFQGISKKDEELIHRAFKIKTIQKFSELKYWKWACGIMDIYEGTSKETDSHEIEKDRSLGAVLTWLLVPIISLIIILYFINYRGCAEKVQNYFSTPGPENITRDASHKELIKTDDEDSADKLRVIETTEQKKADGSQTAETEGDKYYIVMPRESLVSISEKLFGTYKKWPELYQKNRDAVSDPTHLYPGQKLKLP